MTLHSIVIQKLLSTNAHLGRRAAAHHFKVYTYGVRNGMTIIDSEKTLICLRNACHFIGALARQNGRFLFVNTNPLFDEIVEQMEKRIGSYSPNGSAVWRKGGFLTNSSSPKKFRSRRKKIVFAPSQPPDCIVIMDSERKSSVILEADRLQIPVVSLVDPSTPLDCFKRIAYPVPANDSAQFVYLFCNLITKTILLEQKRLGIGSFAAALEDDDEESDDENSVEAKPIEASTSKTKVVDHVTVVPYQSLAPLPEDIVETKKILDQLAVVNFDQISGLGMGFSGPKSVIEVRHGSTFLDLLIKQVESLNSKYECSVPLVLMNTHEDILKVAEKYSKSNIDIQTVTQRQLSQQKPVGGQSDKDELYHTDYQGVLLSLMNGGTIDLLLSQGKEYILVVSSDNVAFMVDPKIVNHLVQNRIEACMEFVEIAQDPPQDNMEKFKPIDARSLWVNLRAVKRLVETDALRPEDHSVPVEAREDTLQGTAASSIIRLFDDAIGINVPQSRFVPMDTTSDLLALQSDLYTSVQGALVQNAARTNPIIPRIHLGPEFEKVTDFQSRFKSIPSLLELDSLEVIGDVWFGADIILKGRVSIVAKPGKRLEIPDRTVLENKEIRGPEDI